MSFSLYASICLLLLVMVSSTMGITCFHRNDFDEVVTERHGCAFCVSLFEVSDGTVTLSCAQRSPSKISKLIFDLSKAEDCQRNIVENYFGEPATDMWTCICFSSKCNFPVTYEEFQTRGNTLQSPYRFSRSH